MTKNFFKEFAREFLKVAEVDLKLAEEFFERKDYPVSIFHSQQCVEKCIKALLESKNEYVKNHGIEIASKLVQLFDENEINLNIFLEAIAFLHDFYVKARYPVLEKGKVKNPYELISESDAKKGLEYAKKVFEETRKYLKKNGII